MNRLFLTVLNLSIICSFVIAAVMLLDKIFHKNYSRRWKYIIWAVIAIRLLLPINVGIIEFPLVQDAGYAVAKAVQLSPIDTIFTGTQTDTGLLSNLQQNKTVTSDSIGQEADTTDMMQRSVNDNRNVANKSDEANKSNAAKNNSMTSKGNLDDKGKNDNKSAKVNTGQEVNQSYDANNMNDTAKDKSNVMNMFFIFIILDIVTFIWIAGAIVFLSYHLLAYYSFNKKVKRWSISVKNNGLIDQFQSICTELGIKRNISLVTCNQVSSPILIGILTPSIVLPSENFTTEQLDFILRHELLHYKQHDLLYKIILLCANALHWFNPLVHYMVYQANLDIELYCDERLISKKSLKYRESYSMTLLQIMTGTVNSRHILLSTSFSSKNKQVKKRFYQIMNAKPTRKGTCFILSIFCLLIIVGNLMFWMIPAKAGNAETMNQQTSKINSDSGLNIVQETIHSAMNKDQLEKTSHVLVVGIDTEKNDKQARADSILLVSVDPTDKKVSLTSFLRDMYVEIPEHGKQKLSAVYQRGGADLIKNTLQKDFELTIDHTVTVNMDAFEDIINTIGGVEIEVSKQEAAYLNKTNYISKKKYRSITVGKQMLNGNQALGYVRIRKVPSIQGKREDLGRTERLRSLLTTVIKQSSQKDLLTLMKVVIKLVPNVTTDMSMDEIKVYLNTALQKGVSTKTLTIPVEGAYEEKVQDGMGVIVPELGKNVDVLKKEIE